MNHRSEAPTARQTISKATQLVTGFHRAAMLSGTRAARGRPMARANRSQFRGTPVSDVPVDSAPRTPSTPSLTMSRPARTISVAERRARLGIRHHLAARARGIAPAALVDDLVALHATDPASVYLSAAARMESLHPNELAEALYPERTLIVDFRSLDVWSGRVGERVE